MAETDFKERVAYLQDEFWKSKKLLPFEGNNRFHPLGMPDTEVIYDFEIQNNIYSITAFFEQEHKLVIYYHANDNNLVNEKAVLNKAHIINDLTLRTYKKELQGNVTIEVKDLTVDDFRRIFERPKRYVVGFNSNYYDLPVAAYILASLYNHTDAFGNPKLPDPHEMRILNNLLINPHHAIYDSQLYNEYRAYFNAKGVSINSRMSFYDLAGLFDNDRTNPNGYYSHQAKPVFPGAAPYLYSTFRRLENTGLHLDMKRLNEKDKDVATMYTSLKRISAQLGYQIEEPDEVDLSSDNDLTKDQITNLLAYNASDVLVTTLIYHTKAYQDVLDVREGLINRFDKDRFKGRLNVNSTSAQFVENVIAPEESDKLVDQEDINYFYPVHGPEYDKIQKEIDKDFIGKNVPYVDKYQRSSYIDEWMRQGKFKPNFDQIGVEYNRRLTEYKKMYDDRSITMENYQKGIKAVNAWRKNAINALNAQIRQALTTDSNLYEEFCKWYQATKLNGYADLDYLDNKWTKYLQTLKGFEPRTGRDGKMHQRFRVKYGEIQEDLLEHAGNKFKKFPNEVYEMYAIFRGTHSVYENGQLTKTAREVGVQKYVEKYLPIYGRKKQTSRELKLGIPGKPIAPPNVYYKTRTSDNSVSGVSVIVQVPNQPMCLSFSVGGVHGEVIKKEPYERDAAVINKYNDALKKIQKIYPDAQDFTHEMDKLIEASKETGQSIHSDKLNFLNLDHKPAELKKLLTLFVTHHSGAKPTYKDFKSVANPKDYVIPIDMHNAVHVDVDSLYPSLMINLHLFSKWTAEYNDPKDFDKTNKSGHWKDVYAKLRAERVRLKKAAASIPKEKWGPLQYHQWSIQLKDKLILNSASGIADGSRDTKVRVNNRAASMRIMGQLALTYLIYTVEPKGVYSTSTNTDGVYLTSKDPNFTEKDIDKEIEHWKLRHHLGATPEIMTHFVSKDSNNRFEQQDPLEKGSPAGGTIGNAFGASSNKKMVQPFVIDAGIVNYFKTHQNICTTRVPNIDDIKAYLIKQQAIILNAKEYTPEVRQAMLSFCWPIQPQKNQSLVLYTPHSEISQYLPLQHVNRLLLVKHGYKLEAYEKGKISKKKQANMNLTKWCINNHRLDPNDLTARIYNVKVTNFNPDWNVLRLNLDLHAYFKSPVWNDLDIDAYAKFTSIRITGEPGHEIWIEPLFKPLTIANKVESLVK